MVLAENANTGSNRGHQVAINGFIASVLIVISFGLYFLWAFLPVEVLDVVLQSYYPDKYWATALPSVLIMSVIYYLAVSFLLMLYRTDPLTDGFCVASTGAALGENHCLDNLLGPNEDVPPIVDIPPAVTNKGIRPWRCLPSFYNKNFVPSSKSELTGRLVEKAMRCSVPQLRAGGLAALLNAVASRRVVLTSEDVYKMCSLLKAKEDTLSLRENYDFIRGIHAQYSEMDPETVSPFQRSFIDGTFATFPNLTASCSLPTSKGEECLPNHCTTQLAADGRGTMTREGAVGLTDGEPTVEQRIAAINELVQEFVSSNFVGSNGMQKVQKHCKALELQLRQMKPFEVVSLVRALSMIHYHDSTFTHLLARRSCEVASKLSASEICRTYYNLSKLQNHDSMVAFVNQIEAQLDKLHREQVQFVAMALERQTQIASAPSRMVPKLLSRGAAVLSEADSAVFHRSLLVVAARYSQNRHPAVAKIMANVSKHLDSISERDLLTVLQTVVDLGFSAASPGMTELLKKTATVAETAEIRNLDTLMDILSVLPVDTGDIMAKLLERLVLESGKLTVPQLAFTLDLLSTYPPARGHACIAALAFAASVRSASFDSETLEQAVLNLAQLQQFSDDFYSLATVLNNEKGGFRRFEKLIGVMKCCTPEVVADVRGQEMITKGILGLAPSLNDEELAETRKLLVHLGVDDKNVHQTIFRRAKQMQRSAGSRWASRGYDDAGSFL